MTPRAGDQHARGHRIELAGLSGGGGVPKGRSCFRRDQVIRSGQSSARTPLCAVSAQGALTHWVFSGKTYLVSAADAAGPKHAGGLGEV